MANISETEVTVIVYSLQIWSFKRWTTDHCVSHFCYWPVTWGASRIVTNFL